MVPEGRSAWLQHGFRNTVPCRILENKACKASGLIGSVSILGKAACVRRRTSAAAKL